MLALLLHALALRTPPSGAPALGRRAVAAGGLAAALSSAAPAAAAERPFGALADEAYKAFEAADYALSERKWQAATAAAAAACPPQYGSRPRRFCIASRSSVLADTG